MQSTGSALAAVATLIQYIMYLVSNGYWLGICTDEYRRLLVPPSVDACRSSTQGRMYDTCYGDEVTFMALHSCLNTGVE